MGVGVREPEKVLLKVAAGVLRGLPVPLQVRLVEQHSDALRVTVGTRVSVEVNVVLALVLRDGLIDEVCVATIVDDTNRVTETVVLKEAVGTRVSVLVRLLLGVRSPMGVTDGVAVGRVVTDRVTGMV